MITKKDAKSISGSINGKFINILIDNNLTSGLLDVSPEAMNASEKELWNLLSDFMSDISSVIENHIKKYKNK